MGFLCLFVECGKRGCEYSCSKDRMIVFTSFVLASTELYITSLDAGSQSARAPGVE